MQFYIGQKVRMLHDSGEGTVTTLVDKHHVEVDLGDDFPIDVHISEIIPIDASEYEYVQPEVPDDSEPGFSGPLGTQLFELSLAVTGSPSEGIKLFLLNPESQDYLYTCYPKVKHKYRCRAHGVVRAGKKEFLFSVSADELKQLKGLYFQLIPFKENSGPPVAVEVHELKWHKERLVEEPEFLSMLSDEGWLINLKKKEIDHSVTNFNTHEFLRVKGDAPVAKGVKVIDLHIEELVEYPHRMSAGDMLTKQLETVDKALSDAVIGNIGKLIFIHGVGTGVLKTEVRKKLKEHAQVRSFAKADPSAYGNGATEAHLI
ncbi:MAG: Smr/MutS family protein [Bacteroidota bacterium]